MSFAVNGFAYFITQYKNLPQKVLDDIKFDYKPGPAPPPPTGLPPNITAEQDRVQRFYFLCSSDSFLQFLGRTVYDFSACFENSVGYLKYFNQPPGVDLATADATNIRPILEQFVLANIDEFKAEQERTVTRTIDTDQVQAKINVAEFFESAFDTMKYELEFAHLLYEDDFENEKDLILEIEGYKESEANYFPFFRGFAHLNWSYVGRFLTTFSSQCEPFLRETVIDQPKLVSEFPPDGVTMLQVFANADRIPGAVKYLHVFDQQVDVNKVYTEQDCKDIVARIFANSNPKFLQEVKNEQTRTVHLHISNVGPPTNLLQDVVTSFSDLTKAEVLVGAQLFQFQNPQDFIDSWDLTASDQILPHLQKIPWTFIASYQTRYYRPFATLELAKKFKATNQGSLLQILAQAKQDNAKFKAYFEYLHAFSASSFTSDAMTQEKVQNEIAFLFSDKGRLKEEQERTVSIALEQMQPPTKSNLVQVRDLLTKSLTDENFVAEDLYQQEAYPLDTCATQIKPTLSAADFFQFIAHLQGIKWCFVGQYYHTFQQQIISALA